MRQKILLLAVQEALRLLVGSTEGEQIDGGEPGLLARGHKDNGGQLGGVPTHGMVDGLDHGHQARRGVRDGKALHVELQRNRAHVRVEAEEAVGAGPQPLAQVLGIGHGRAQSHNAHLALDLRGDVAHARAHHLQHRLQEGEEGGRREGGRREEEGGGGEEEEEGRERREGGRRVGRGGREGGREGGKRERRERRGEEGGKEEEGRERKRREGRGGGEGEEGGRGGRGKGGRGVN